MSTERIHREMAPAARRVLEASMVPLATLLNDAFEAAKAAMAEADEKSRRNDSMAVISQLAAISLVDLILRLATAYPDVDDATLVELAMHDVQLRTLSIIGKGLAAIGEPARHD